MSSLREKIRKVSPPQPLQVVRLRSRSAYGVARKSPPQSPTLESSAGVWVVAKKNGVSRVSKKTVSVGVESGKKRCDGSASKSQKNASVSVSGSVSKKRLSVRLGVKKTPQCGCQSPPVCGCQKKTVCGCQKKTVCGCQKKTVCGCQQKRCVGVKKKRCVGVKKNGVWVSKKTVCGCQKKRCVGVKKNGVWVSKNGVWVSKKTVSKKTVSGCQRNGVWVSKKRCFLTYFLFLIYYF